MTFLQHMHAIKVFIRCGMKATISLCSQHGARHLHFHCRLPIKPPSNCQVIYDRYDGNVNFGLEIPTLRESVSSQLVTLFFYKLCLFSTCDCITTLRNLFVMHSMCKFISARYCYKTARHFNFLFGSNLQWRSRGQSLEDRLSTVEWLPSYSTTQRVNV